MRIIINTRQLATELRLLNHVVMNKPPLAILSNVWIEATEELHFLTTDLEVGFQTRCQAKIEESGTITLPIRRLLDIVEQLSDSEMLIATAGEQVHLHCGRFKSRLQTLPPRDFPPAPHLPVGGASFDMLSLQGLVSRVQYAVDKDGKQIKGALFHLDGNIAALVATDGRRISIATMNRVEQTVSDVVLPIKTLGALLALFDKEPVTFSCAENHLFFATEHRMFFSRMLIAKFPDYQRVLPKQHDKKAIVDRLVVAAALRRVGLMAEVNQAVYFAFDPGQLTLTTSSTLAGDAVESLPVNYNGDSMKLCVSWRYVLDFLEAAIGQYVSLEFKDALSPILLTDGDFLNVVMAMRV